MRIIDFRINKSPSTGFKLCSCIVGTLCSGLSRLHKALGQININTFTQKPLKYIFTKVHL